MLDLISHRNRVRGGGGKDIPSSNLVTLGQNFFSFRYSNGYAACSLV
jgi:hypothetical protein